MTKANKSQTWERIGIGRKWKSIGLQWEDLNRFEYYRGGALFLNSTWTPSSPAPTLPPPTTLPFHLAPKKYLYFKFLHFFPLRRFQMFQSGTHITKHVYIPCKLFKGNINQSVRDICSCITLHYILMLRLYILSFDLFELK